MTEGIRILFEVALPCFAGWIGYLWGRHAGRQERLRAFRSYIDVLLAHIPSADKDVTKFLDDTAKPLCEQCAAIKRDIKGRRFFELHRAFAEFQDATGPQRQRLFACLMEQPCPPNVDQRSVREVMVEALKCLSACAE